MSDDEQENTNLLRKLAGLQNIIPQFDNNSAVTPKFFLDSCDSITTLANCQPPEKLIILKSRIRGDALSQLINSPDLSQETDYEEFKNKFLAYFDSKISLATRQQQFANCRMQPGESVKIYAARISLVTQKFFNNPDLKNKEVKALFEQSKLSKFLEGLLPEFRHAALMKDPQSFKEAVDFVELLQANNLAFPQQDMTIPSTVGNIKISNEDIKTLIETHALQTHNTVCALSKEIDNLKLSSKRNFSQNNTVASNTYENSYSPNRYVTVKYRQFPPCTFCGKSNHLARYCYYNTNKPKSNHARNPHFSISQTRGQAHFSERKENAFTPPRHTSHRGNLNSKRGDRQT